MTDTENWKRLVIHPIQNVDLWKLYKKAQSLIWVAEEIDFSKDSVQWHTLKEQERELLSSVLAFFASADGLIMENIIENLFESVRIPEARSFYAFQIYIENIHSEVYSSAICAYISDSSERNRLLSSCVNNPKIMEKSKWIEKNVRSRTIGLPDRLVAFAATEMLFFCGSFAVLFWMKSRGLLHALTFSNDLIARDESLHVLFAATLYLKFESELPSKSREIILEANKIEKKFWTACLPNGLPGMNLYLMERYIDYITDRLFEIFGATKHFHLPNPFPFAETSSLEAKSNFFERKVAEYQPASSLLVNMNFSTSEEF